MQNRQSDLFGTPHPPVKMTDPKLGRIIPVVGDKFLHWKAFPQKNRLVIISAIQWKNILCRSIRRIFVLVSYSDQIAVRGWALTYIVMLKYFAHLLKTINTITKRNNYRLTKNTRTPDFRPMSFFVFTIIMCL